MGTSTAAKTCPQSNHTEIQSDLLLVTVNPREFDAVYATLRPRPGNSRVTPVSINRITYEVGLFGTSTAALIKCGMGATARDAAITTLMEAIPAVSPRAVVALGVAFGRDASTQEFGQVLVSSHLIQYEPARQSVVPVWRGGKVEPGVRLKDRFSHAMHTWTLPSGCTLRPALGPLLSGEKLIDDPDFKLELMRRFPDAIGGEMEGSGIYAAAARNEIEWIVVKGIADWADGHKKGTDPIQLEAARNATSLALHVFSAQDVLSGMPASVVANEPQLGMGANGPKRIEQSVRTVKRMVRLAAEFSTWTPSQQEAFLKLLDDTVQFREAIQAKSYPGSVLVVLDLSEADAKLLDDTYANGTLQKLHVMRVYADPSIITAVEEGIPLEFVDNTQKRAKSLSHPDNRETGEVVSAGVTISHVQGVVKWYDPKKGFGFIVGPEGQDIFVHYLQIEGDEFKVLRDGSLVEYDAIRGNKGWHATRVKRLDLPKANAKTSESFRPAGYLRQKRGGA